MKCIYCNTDSNLTVSDIIPFALTGAKVRKKFVCRTHNAFTNDNYEKAMISQLAIFRNLLGLTERDGAPVRFIADLSIDKYTFEKTSISDKTSILGNTKRLFSTTDKDGHKIVVGDKNALLKIKGASEDKIEDLELSDVSIVAHSDIRKLFVSDQVLHGIAKIAYEWHCYINDIEQYQENEYNEIVSYILDPESKNIPVELVIDETIQTFSDESSRTGSNILFEYNDLDGHTYVIFSLWNVIQYKVKICKYSITALSPMNIYNAYIYHTDGTESKAMFAVVGNPHINSANTVLGIGLMAEEIKLRLSKLGERDLSREYLKINSDKIKQLLPKYKNGSLSLAKLLDYEHQDRLVPLFILEQLLSHKAEYDSTKSFTENMQQILRTSDRYYFTNELKTEILQRYISMEQNNTFTNMVESAINFFETTCFPSQ